MTTAEAIALTRAYTDRHWEETFRVSRDETSDEIALPRPHTVPSTDPTMWLFFYWDTYFTNLGLIRQGRVAQARNNAENVLHLIERLGCVPNISVRIAHNRSQIPVAAVLFDELHRLAPDRAWLERIYAAITREYAFWAALRSSPTGLAANNTHADPATLADFHEVIRHRLKDIPDEPVARLVYLRHKMAECEVWDFNPRFDQRCADFNAVDTNAVLYQVETIAAGRMGMMPPHAQLGADTIKDLANYVRSLSGLPHDAARAAKGKDTFNSAGCSGCHGPEATGMQAIGAPNLTDKVWLYGSSEATIVETITLGRQNRMPSWKAFLGDAKDHLLTAYVYSLSHGAK